MSLVTKGAVASALLMIASPAWAFSYEAAPAGGGAGFADPDRMADGASSALQQSMSDQAERARSGERDLASPAMSNAAGAQTYGFGPIRSTAQTYVGPGQGFGPPGRTDQGQGVLTGTLPSPGQ
ncbi:MAG: hypothetical protein WDM92_02410 [Caulobacteraceae bacterium]